MESIQRKNKAEGKTAGKKLCVNLLFTAYNTKISNEELGSEWIHSEEVTTLQPLSFIQEFQKYRQENGGQDFS